MPRPVDGDPPLPSGARPAGGPPRGGGVVTRFAPSPTGQLHLGHAFAALVAWDVARRSGGRFVLRIEDIDTGRCRPEHETAILEDLAWLGLHWPEPVRRQSEHLEDYRQALDQLDNLGVLYPCFCTRAEIQAEVEAAGGAPQGPEGPLYPGTCRALTRSDRQTRLANGEPFALRLDVGQAWRLVGGDLAWHDRLAGTIRATPGLLGDVVLARKDIGTSYHLAVTVDDALQGISLVTRGEDLFHATHIHRLLQELLGLPVPQYLHHALVTDDHGTRLAKRTNATTLASLRQGGATPESIRQSLGLGTPPPDP